MTNYLSNFVTIDTIVSSLYLTPYFFIAGMRVNYVIIFIIKLIARPSTKLVSNKHVFLYSMLYIVLSLALRFALRIHEKLSIYLTLLVRKA